MILASLYGACRGAYLANVNRCSIVKPHSYCSVITNSQQRLHCPLYEQAYPYEFESSIPTPGASSKAWGMHDRQIGNGSQLCASVMLLSIRPIVTQILIMAKIDVVGIGVFLGLKKL